MKESNVDEEKIKRTELYHNCWVWWLITEIPISFLVATEIFLSFNKISIKLYVSFCYSWLCVLLLERPRSSLRDRGLEFVFAIDC